MLLNGRADVAHATARPRIPKPHEEALPRHAHQLLHLLRHAADQEGAGGVPMESVEAGPHVHGEDVPVL